LINYRQTAKKATKRAVWATLLFLLFYLFYNIELIREKTEDFGFDIVNKFHVFNKEQNVDSPKVMIFVYDDLYMKQKKFLDSKNRTTYGYGFPRDNIAEFINNLDELCEELDDNSSPKALFVDYDFSFSTTPYGKVASAEDIKFIDTLKKPHQYTILLPQLSDDYNFIKNYPDRKLQQAIKNDKIKFVSVSLLSSNGVIRRYKGFDSFKGGNVTSVDIELWKIATNQTRANFDKDDIIANRVLFKNYRDPTVEEDCVQTHSLYSTLTKYSVNCSLFELPYEEYNNSIIMLGSTFVGNGDNFNVLDVLGAKTLNGIDIHANTLMTMLTLNSPLQRLSWFPSMIIVFLSFFLIDFSSLLLLQRFNIENYKVELILVLVLSSTVLFYISVLLLDKWYLWFNWSVPVILLQLVEIIVLVQKKSPKLVFKFTKILKFIKVFKKW